MLHSMRIELSLNISNFYGAYFITDTCTVDIVQMHIIQVLLVDHAVVGSRRN